MLTRTPEQMALTETWDRRHAFDDDLLRAYAGVGRVEGAGPLQRVQGQGIIAAPLQGPLQRVKPSLPAYHSAWWSQHARPSMPAVVPANARPSTSARSSG